MDIDCVLSVRVVVPFHSKFRFQLLQDDGKYTSVVCKTMEHILVSQIMKHLEDNNILSDSQFGFRSKHSCESQLFITINDIAKGMDENHQVDVAILDFCKAFDKVEHSRLIICCTN